MTIAIGAVVLESFAADARVLLVKRGHAPLAGKWSLPGGRPNANESLVDAVHRELGEEAALRVDVLAALDVVRIAAEGYDYEIHEFLAIARNPAALRPGDDAADARWATAEEIDAAELGEDARRVLRQALRVVKRLAMKSGVCPKCQHHEILFVPQIADRDDDDNVRPLSVHVIHFSWKDDDEMGRLQAYICKSCGFTELYTAGADRLPLEKIPGSEIIDSKKPKG